MGKRNAVVVLSSSDDEDGDRLLSLNQRYSKRSSRRLVTRTEPIAEKKKKRRRISGSIPRFCDESSYVDEIRASFSDFNGVISEFKVSAGSLGNTKELWVDKYKPCSLEDLAVQKKKVEEVKVWFEERLGILKGDFRKHVLVISGQAGVGKSATVHVIASHLGAKVCEWNTPTPTVWQEHAHNSNIGTQYTSKLDEFGTFVDRVRKYGLLPSSFPGSKLQTILLIDDLPLTNGRASFEKLRSSLLLLVASAQIPTAILMTVNGQADSADQTTRVFEELQKSLESAGASMVAFNPITFNSIRKTLTKICRKEQSSIADEHIDLIAKSSGGDIRQAISSLQLFSLKPDLRHSLSQPDHIHSNERAVYLNTLEGGFSLHFGRDETLSLFHALGKFLHNKRETENAMELDGDAFNILDKFSRLPLKMNAPEMILCQSHGQARPITDFLHENVLDFLNEDAMNDAMEVASYLSDADLLLASVRRIMAANNEADGVLQSASASVAVRGVLYANSHPRSRWHAIRKPKLWQVEQLSLHNKKEMVKQRFIANSMGRFCDLSVLATDFRPVVKWLGDHNSFEEARQVDMDIKKLSLCGYESEISDDDEIEE